MSDPLLNQARAAVPHVGPRIPLLASTAAQPHVSPQLRADMPEHFEEMSNGARRRAVAAWALQLVAEHGPEDAARRVAAEIDRVDAARHRELPKAEDRGSSVPTDRATGVPRTVYSVSPYVVPCATGCGHWLPAAGPRPVVARSSLCDRPRGQARRAAQCARRLERAA